MTPIFNGLTRNGRLHLDDREAFEKFLQGLNGCDIELSVRKRRHIRSLSANSYYWAVVIKSISDYSGHTMEEVHESLKAEFLIDRSGGMPHVRSTTELDVHQFSEYVERCIELASSLGISIPAADNVEV